MNAPVDDTILAPLRSGLRTLRLPDDLEDPLMAYLQLLTRWNRTYNLTAIRDPAQMVTLHILDSLSMLPALVDGNLADLGSGAGLPGIPLAIARPRLAITLVESNGKKARFLRETVRNLRLNNIQVAETRAEALDAHAAFSQITARALGTLTDILRVGGHLLSDDGNLLAMKGIYPTAELRELPEGWCLKTAERLIVPGLNAERHLLIVGRC